MNQPILWYASRATGLIALVLFTGSVVLGALGGGRFVTPRWPRFAVAAVHRNVSLLGCVFLVIHIVTSIVDPYAGIGWLDAVVPFVSIYHPFWLGMGAVASDLIIAIMITSLLRPRVHLRLWRYVHWTSYACWPIAILHGIGTNPADFTMSWVLVVNIACVLAVALAIGWRAGTSNRDGDARARAAG